MPNDVIASEISNVRELIEALKKLPEEMQFFEILKTDITQQVKYSIQKTKINFSENDGLLLYHNYHHK